jgi:hypothetical protein
MGRQAYNEACNLTNVIARLSSSDSRRSWLSWTNTKSAGIFEDMAELKTYTFFKHDGGGGPPVFELEEFAADEDARAFAVQLLSKNGRYDSIEIWDDAGGRFTLTRICAGPSGASKRRKVTGFERDNHPG